MKRVSKNKKSLSAAWVAVLYIVISLAILAVAVYLQPGSATSTLRNFLRDPRLLALNLLPILAVLGLSDREAGDFIAYWLPRMQDNPYNLIAFQGRAYTDAAELAVEPEPDTVIRVFMAFRPLGEEMDIPEQELPSPERTGCTLVEWGGTEIED